MSTVVASGVIINLFVGTSIIVPKFLILQNSIIVVGVLMHSIIVASIVVKSISIISLFIVNGCCSILVNRCSIVVQRIPIFTV